VRIRLHHNTFLLAAAAAAISIATAPSASAAPSEQHCSDAGGSTNCQRPGNVQVHTSPRALPRVFPPPSTRGGVIAGTARGSRSTGLTRSGWHLGITRYTAGFQPRPSVLRRQPVSQAFRCPARSSSACTPQIPNGTDTGNSTVYQKPGNAQSTAQIGLAAQQATQLQYPSSASTATDTAGPTVHQKPGNAEITAQPGTAAQNADQQAAFFPVSDLPGA
jgi:hypothetical protein